MYLTSRLDLVWREPRSPRIVGILHDLCKCDQYRRNEDRSYSFVPNLPLIGHGDKSVILAQSALYGTSLGLTEEEILCIRWHMGGYDDAKNWNHVDAAIKKYPNVLYTHTADMMASRIHNI